MDETRVLEMSYDLFGIESAFLCIVAENSYLHVHFRRTKELGGPYNILRHYISGSEINAFKNAMAVRMCRPSKVYRNMRKCWCEF